MSEHIKTEYEIAVEFNDLKIKGDNKWVSLDWFKEQVKKRRDMFQGLSDVSELNWVLKLLQLEEYNQ
jgi:hypothetical protein